MRDVSASLSSITNVTLSRSEGSDAKRPSASCRIRDGSRVDVFDAPAGAERVRDRTSRTRFSAANPDSAASPLHTGTILAIAPA
jgi:hypothetical protein